MPVPDTFDRTAESREVMNAIRRIIHALQVSSHRTQKSAGLSGAQIFLLQVLASGAVMSVNELAARSYTHQSSVSTVVSKLVEAKLVKRSPSAADARRLDLSITPAGRRLLKSQDVTPQERMIASLNQLPPSRLFELRMLLDEVITNSGFDSGPVRMFFERESELAAPKKRLAARVPSR